MSGFLRQLTVYQAWRRGADTEQPNPFDIGQALDYAISVTSAAEALVAAKDEAHAKSACEQLEHAVLKTSALTEQQAKMAAEAANHVAGMAELREVATLAYRALEDAHRVLSTIDGDDTHEQHELSLLAKRVQDASVSLFTVLRKSP